MSIKTEFDDALVAYVDAHAAWKRAPDGPQKVSTKTAMKTAHGAFLNMAKLYVPQIKKKPPER